MHIHGLILVGIIPAKCTQLEMTKFGFCFTRYVFLKSSSAYSSLHLKRGKKYTIYNVIFTNQGSYKTLTEVGPCYHCFIFISSKELFQRQGTNKMFPAVLFTQRKVEQRKQVVQLITRTPRN